MERQIAIIISVALVSFLCLLTSIPSSFADGTVYAQTFTGLFLKDAPADNFPPQFYLAFIDMKEAHVTLSSGTYTFEITVASTPPDWVTSDWRPTLARGTYDMPVLGVGYGLWLWDASGTFIGVIRVAWIGGALYPEAQILDVKTPYKAFYNAGVGYQVMPKPSSLNFVFDQASNCMTMTITQSDFLSLFPTATQWRATTRACAGAVAGGVYIQEHSNLADLPS